MKKYLLFSILFLGFLSNAQINFLNHNVIDKNYFGGISNVFTIDMDNDGDLDVISSNTNDKIVWQENLGQGNFGDVKVITNQLMGISSVSLADINADGKVDIISTSSTDGKVVWYKNLGQGVFSTTILFSSSTITGATIAKAGDMDGDGDLDIVATTASNVLSWFRNTNGQGSFSTAISIAVITGITSIDIKDADGDGDNDILTDSTLQDQYIKLGLVKNLGNSNFSTFQLLNTIVPDINYSINSMVFFKDLDNDGDTDILFSANNKLCSFINIGSGVYGALNVIYTGYFLNRFIDLDFTDMDNDGDLDIVTCCRVWQSPDKVAWFENNATHTYTTMNTILNSTSNQMLSIKVADIDGDNVKDLVVGNRFEDYLIWHKSYTEKKPITKYVYGTNSAKAFDMDNDGDLDLISCINSNKLVWYENLDGHGTTGIQKLITFQDNTSYFSVGDIDGDSDNDILIDGKWFENDGSGHFISTHVVNEGYPNNVSNVRLADVDNDGKLDIIAIENLSNGNSTGGWYKNLGLGNFGARQLIFSSLNSLVNRFDFADYDGDGLGDLLLGTQAKIVLVKNLNGSFAPLNYFCNYSSTSVFFIDMDGDGDKDILAENIPIDSSQTGIGWFRNEGGTLNPFVNFVTNSSYMTGTTPADMDGDGDADVISFNTSNNKTVWMENTNGLGTFVNNGFQTTLITHSSTNSSQYSLADIDNDGKIDLIFSNSSGNPQLSWFKSNGLSTNKINGLVRLDSNNNGCDGLDYPMQNVRVNSQTSNSDTYSTFTSTNGYYQFYLSGPGNYTTSLTSTLPYYLNINPNSYSTNFTGVNNIQSLNFCLSSNTPTNDLEVTIYPITAANPGFESEYLIVYSNHGTTPMNGNVKFQYDASKLTLSTSIPAYTSQSLGQIIYNFTNLNPFETKIVKLKFLVAIPPTVTMGSQLSFTSTINPITNDIQPTNNVFNLNQTVVASLDPNDISVLEGDSIMVNQINDYLHYVIRFQNTGTANATNVVVTNTLDNGLDWNSMQIEASSHSNFVSIKNGKEVSFVFNGINLPYSSLNEPNSHGFVCYKIKPKNTSIPGDIFYNAAEIYFDFNSAIFTNSVSTEVIGPLNSSVFDYQNMILHPNPTSGKVNISVNFEIKSLSIYNLFGQKIIDLKNSQEIDLSNFDSGIYFIKVEDFTGRSITKKVIKY